jgi:hypothetical protein
MMAGGIEVSLLLFFVYRQKSTEVVDARGGGGV